MFERKKSSKKRVLQENKKKYLVSKKIIFLLLILAVGLCGYILFFSPLLNIKRIDIALNNINCTNSKNLETYFGINKNILFLDETEIKEKIKKDFFCVGDIEIKKEFPSRLKVSLIKREPKAMLNFFEKIIDKESSDSAALGIFESSESAKINYSVFKGQPKRYIVDKEGVIFSEDPNNTNIPEINLLRESDLNLGNKISKQFLSGVELVVKIKDLNLTLFKSAFFGENTLGLTVTNEDYGEFSLIFNLNKDVSREIASLQLILQKAKMNSGFPTEGTRDGEIIEMIDLRFDKPIVRYSPKKNER